MINEENNYLLIFILYQSCPVFAMIYEVLRSDPTYSDTFPKEWQSKIEKVPRGITILFVTCISLLTRIYYHQYDQLLHAILTLQQCIKWLN